MGRNEIKINGVELTKEISEECKHDEESCFFIRHGGSDRHWGEGNPGLGICEWGRDPNWGGNDDIWHFSGKKIPLAELKWGRRS